MVKKIKDISYSKSFRIIKWWAVGGPNHIRGSFNLDHYNKVINARKK